ncbi:MAG: acetyl-CoA carboxylase biotin carboxylase subunit [bacterium]
MFNKILIANRGEIALRIIRACKELNIKTVSVYSKADVNSLHVRFADESVCIGEAPSSKSYLNIPAIISAAEITDAEAIHPGYGFLAENAHFAEICESCKIKFIGPSPRIIDLMGNKLKAKEKMKKARIPVLPGGDNLIKTEQEALSVAKEIGYPIIIKAALGGGGKGMRIAHTDVSLVNAFLTAKAETKSAFGDESLYIEKYIEKPKHIEFQLLADNYKNIIHLGERECTIQRKHQKLIEESPSTILNQEIRNKMGEVVLKGAKAVNFSNVGTMEFLVDEKKNFYFMEMNTRIQVEHSVTETITGIDLIKEQIKMANGEKLKYKQKDIVFKNHSIECRINAEDPDNSFIPCPGKIVKLHIPGGPGVRVDSHIYTDYVVSPYYDSLLAKLICFGQTREEAIARMSRALDEFIIEGIKTTIPFHKKAMKNAAFLKGKFYTDFVQKMEEEK